MNESVFARRKAERKAVGAVEPAATAAAASTEAQAEPSIPEQAPVSIEETVPAPEATASADAADAAGAAESESAGSAWKADPMSPSGSVFKLSPSIRDAPARVEAAEEPVEMASYAPASGSIWDTFERPAPNDDPAAAEPAEDGDAPRTGAEELDATRPILAAVPAEEAAADPEPACQPATSLPAPEWAPASLGISSAAKAADTGPAFGGASGIGPAPVTGGGAGGNQGSGGAGGGWGGGGAGGGQSGGGPGKRKLPIILGVAAALIVLIGGGGFFVLHNSGKPSTSAAGGAGKSKTKVVVAVAKGPEHVSSISPTDGATDVNGGAPVVVTFSEPLSPTSPMPTLKPDIKGNWQVSGDKATFIPAKGFWQHTKVKVTVPAGATGVESNGGGKLATPVTASFKTGKFSLVRLEQLLGQLGYLPLTWAPSSGTPAPMSNLNAQYSAAYAPPQGTYSWDSGYPARLTSLWKPDAPSEILRGAVAAFLADHDFITDMIAENQEGLVVSGSIGQELWKAMFKAVARDQKNKNGYTYAVASQHQPETLTVWHDGKIIFHHLANTGVPAAPTAARTDPVYIRYQSQIMRGTNPDGSKYADQVYWVAYFHAGEAVHYFNRSAYGYQQSLGCVELPYSEAKQIWPFLTYGTLVTVTKV